MVKVTYIEHDGTEHAVELKPGISLMEGAVFNNIRGVYADCGGDGGCATCHVYVDEPWGSKVAEKSHKEKNTLRFALNVKDNSRLSCFIQVDDQLDGMIVRMPRRQF